MAVILDIRGSDGTCVFRKHKLINEVLQTELRFNVALQWAEGAASGSW